MQRIRACLEPQTMIRCKPLLLASAIFAALATTSTVHAQQRSFDIPAQPAVDAIPELARQAQVQIIAPAGALEGVQTPAVRGEMELEQALRVLLEDTGLEVQSTEGNVILLRQRNAPPREPAGSGGTIVGQVIDPATGEYLRNAIIRLEGRQVAVSGEAGAYRIDQVPQGAVQVSVDFTGYEGQVAGVEVRAGQSVRQDFELRLSGGGVASSAETLDAVRVVGAREGDARAIMEQRASMNITSVLSSESYGEIDEGNPGEFIKYMPGVNVDQVADGTVRTVALRGMDPAYTGITLNGVSLAGVDANGGAADARVFSFEQMSIGSLDSIEISKTISADVDANSPAGTIDMRTKRAFDRKGRSIVASLQGNTHSDLWDSMERTGPDEGGYGGRRLLPGAKINYSDVFMDKRLGVALGLGQNHAYYEQEQVTASRNYAPNAYQDSPLAVTAIDIASGQREIYRGFANATIDFKATDNLILSLAGLYNESGIWAATSSGYTFTTGARANNSSVAGGDGMLDIDTNLSGSATRVSVTNNRTYKKGSGRTYIPGFEYNNAYLKLDGHLFYSDSRSSYDPMGEKGVAYATGALTVKSGQYTASRDDLYGQGWNITQTAGPDWADTSSWGFSSPLVIRTGQATEATSERTGGALNLAFDADVGGVPVAFKTGLKVSEAAYVFTDRDDLYRYKYAGPLSQTELLEAIRSGSQFSAADSGVTITSISGSHDIYLPSMDKLAQLFLANPGHWVPTATTSASEWYNINVGENRDYTESMQAAYFMGTAQFTGKLRARAGLRWEKTHTDSYEIDPRPLSEVVAAGHAVNDATGLPTTVEGMEFMYGDRPRVHRRGSYDDFFPSASMKYSFDDSLDLQVGYSRTIRRPDVDQMSGVWRVSDGLSGSGTPTQGVVVAPNPNLLPEYSDNLSLRLVKYYEPVGLLAVNYYRNRIKGLFQTADMTADEFGYTGQDYADYIFRTTTQVAGEAVDIQGVELEFNHAMDYLPPALQGFTVRGSFMWNEPEVPILRQAQKNASFSVSYARGGLKLNLNTTWSDYVYRTTTPSWFTPFWGASLSGSYAFVKKSASSPYGLEAFFSMNNLIDHARNVVVPDALATGGGLGDGNHSAIYQEYGRTATLGLRARF